MGQFLYFALPHNGKKNKAAAAVSDRIEYRIKRVCKIPVNLIKHSGFGMTWVDMSQGNTGTSGYCVSGPVAERTYAPSKFRASAGDNPEAYSFAYALRECFISIYDMADITENALTHAGLLQRSAVEFKLKDARREQLQEMLNRLNCLPLNGFPDEHGARVPAFSLEGEALYATTRALRQLPGTFHIKTELRNVDIGMSYKLPYFRSDVDPKIANQNRRQR